MIVRTIFRVLWAATVFVFAVAVALFVLFAFGAIWVGDELRAAAPNDPVLAMGAKWFGIVLFVGTVTPALTVLPAAIAAIVGEALRWPRFPCSPRRGPIRSRRFPPANT